MRRKPALHSGQMTSPFLMQQLCTPVITVPRRLPWLELKLIGLRRLKRLVPVVVRRRHSLEVHCDDMRRCVQLRRALFIGGSQMRAHLIGGLRDLDAHAGKLHRQFKVGLRRIGFSTRVAKHRAWSTVLCMASTRVNGRGLLHAATGYHDLRSREPPIGSGQWALPVAIAIVGWTKMRIAHVCMTGRERHPAQSWRCRLYFSLGLPQGALHGAAVVRAWMLGARKPPQLAVDLRLDAPHRQQLKFCFGFAGLDLGADLELPFPDIRNCRHRYRELYALVSRHLCCSLTASACNAAHSPAGPPARFGLA